jgi:hypothetical protein
MNDEKDALQFLMALAVTASGAIIGLSYFLFCLFV